jgi:hypothetical protein
LSWHDGSSRTLSWLPCLPSLTSTVSPTSQRLPVLQCVHRRPVECTPPALLVALARRHSAQPASAIAPHRRVRAVSPHVARTGAPSADPWLRARDRRRSRPQPRCPRSGSRSSDGTSPRECGVAARAQCPPAGSPAATAQGQTEWLCEAWSAQG